MFFGTWKPNVAQRPRQNTMYQTPLDIGTLTWPRTYCKKRLLVTTQPGPDDAALNIVPQVMFCHYTLRHWRGRGYESAQPQQRQRALTLTSAPPPPMRHFGGWGGVNQPPLLCFIFSFEAATVLYRCSAYHQFLPPRPSDTSRSEWIAKWRRVVRVATPRRIWGPTSSFCFHGPGA
jgi:hypothetical protein